MNLGLFYRVIVCAIFLSSFSFAGLQKDIPFGTNSAGQTIKLDAFVPDGNGVFPAVIFVHGGSWSSGDKQQGVEVLTELFNNEKFVWFTIDYRLAPQFRWPVCLEDTKTAVRWIKANAAYFKVDPNRVALMGYSAGGQLAALTAMDTDEQLSVAAVVLFAAPTDMPALIDARGGDLGHIKKLFGVEVYNDMMRQKLAEISPVHQLRTGLPPFLLVHGSGDDVVPYQQSEDFKQKAAELSVPCKLLKIENATHDIRKWKEAYPNYTTDIINWLNTFLVSK
jgi:alpha-L-fucosidase 2